jgi:hypothetical protein
MANRAMLLKTCWPCEGVRKVEELPFDDGLFVLNKRFLKIPRRCEFDNVSTTGVAELLSALKVLQTAA